MEITFSGTNSVNKFYNFIRNLNGSQEKIDIYLQTYCMDCNTSLNYHFNESDIILYKMLLSLESEISGIDILCKKCLEEECKNELH
ncbi:MAG: hypothetical protein KKD48_01780 [Nanoarchaeota archaeon]|nr:hypothetical protein [Nanoarchaeota archaeon]